MVLFALGLHKSLVADLGAHVDRSDFIEVDEAQYKREDSKSQYRHVDDGTVVMVHLKHGQLTPSLMTC